jgi:hypothetical protein
VGGGVQQGPLGTSAIYWPIVPALSDYDDGEFSGMQIGRGNLSTRRKPPPAALCPPQINILDPCISIFTQTFDECKISG